jgi:hypothetical protein
VNAAAADDMYRVQLLDLAALHGLYSGRWTRSTCTKRSLGRWEALARHRLDRRQLDETRARDPCRSQHRPNEVK